MLESKINFIEDQFNFHEIQSESHMLFQLNCKQNFKKNNNHTFNCILHLALNIMIYTLYIELFSFTIISGAHQNLVRPSGSFAAAVAGF